MRSKELQQDLIPKQHVWPNWPAHLTHVREAHDQLDASIGNSTSWVAWGITLDPLKPESFKQSVHKNKFLFLSTRSCFDRSIVSAIKSNPARTKIRASPHAAALNTPDPERGLRQLRQDSHFPTRLGTWRAGSYASMVKMCLSLHAWTLDTPCERVARPSANCVIHHTFEHLTCTILRKGSPQNPPEPTKFAFRFTFGHWTRRILRYGSFSRSLAWPPQKKGKMVVLGSSCSSITSLNFLGS